MHIKYIRDKSYKGWIALDVDFPFVTAIGKTKVEAKKSLMEDLKIIFATHRK